MSARKSIDDVGDVASGYDTARVTSDLDPDEAARRARQHADARGVIAAHVFERFGVDVTAECRSKHPASLPARLAVKEFAELAAMLGLDTAPQRTPGTCGGCGAVLPVTVATPSKTADYRHGMCWACSHGTAAPTRQPAPAPPARHDRPYRGGQGHCQHCDRSYRLDGDGRLRRHPGWETRAGGVRVRVAQWCAGSGGYPGERAA